MDGLRARVSAGGNIGERLMAVGERNYGESARWLQWLSDVEIPTDRIDDMLLSGGMQQRFQIARNLVTSPKLIFWLSQRAAVWSVQSNRLS